MKHVVLSLLTIVSLTACFPRHGPGFPHRPLAPNVPRHVLPTQLSFNVLDADGDGQLSHDEFIEGDVLAPADSQIPTRQELFELVDEDADGVVNRAEYDERLAQLFSPMG